MKLNKRKSYPCINLLLLIVPILFSLLAGELILALMGFKPYIQSSSDQPSLRRPSANSFEEMIDKGLVKGIYGNLRPDNELGYTYYDEPHGFKDRKNFYDDWSGYKRILMLGDSFTMGAGAQRGSGFVDLLDDYYQNQGIVFFNTGVGGYTQNNQLGVLKKYFDVIKPSMVILCFYTGNDFGDSLAPLDRMTDLPGKWIKNYEINFMKDGVEIRRRSLDEIFMLYQQCIGNRITPRKHPSSKKFLRYNLLCRSRVGSLIWHASDKIRKKLNHLSARYKKNRAGKESNASRDYVYSTAEDYTLKVKRHFSQKSTPLRVFIIPDHLESELKSEQPGSKGDRTQNRYNRGCYYTYGITRANILKIEGYLSQRNTPLYVFIIPDRLKSKVKLEKSHNYHRAISILRELSIPYLDPFDSLTLQDYHLSPNDHWNDSGHFKAYELLKSYIDEILKKEGDRASKA